MFVAGLFLYLICGSVITSASIYGSAIEAGEEWWFLDLFLKFYSPSGNNYFINCRSGELSLESPDFSEDNVKDVSLPYISFVTLNLKIYDIYFENENLNYIPHIVEKNITYKDRSTFIRHSLHSFVGPNNQVYRLLYNDGNISITAEEPAKHVDHIEIKTLGAFSKYEHTYSFSQNGDSATDITISPATKLTERSIPLPEKDASKLKEQELLLVNYKTPSGKKYLITNDLSIASVQNQEGVNNQNESYITFIEPSGKEYCVYFREEGKEYFPNLVPVENKNDYNAQNIYRPIKRLLSFVGPNKKLYRINHDNENGEDIPILDSSPDQSSNTQIVVLVTSKYYKKFIKFIFSNDGKDLIDRVEEYDSTPLNELPPLDIEEVEANSEIAKASFLKFFSPSGRNYYLTPDDSKANFAVEKDSKKDARSPYLSFNLQDGRQSKIFVTPGEVPYMETSPSDGRNSTNSLLSFVTPDKKIYKMRMQVENGIRTNYIDTTPQPKDPLDEEQGDALAIVIASTAREYSYIFTWNGDKLVEASTRPRKRVSTNVLKSLIG